jgi:hypothetical protein
MDPILAAHEPYNGKSVARHGYTRLAGEVRRSPFHRAAGDGMWFSVSWKRVMVFTGFSLFDRGRKEGMYCTDCAGEIGGGVSLFKL